MKLSDFVEGLVIFQQYTSDNYCLASEHDEFYVSKTTRPIEPEDIAKLLKLGWFQSAGAQSAEDSNDGKDHPYDPEESWKAYV